VAHLRRGRIADFSVVPALSPGNQFNGCRPLHRPGIDFAKLHSGQKLFGSIFILKYLTNIHPKKQHTYMGIMDNL
jgi:hypothetical protein